MRKLIADRIVDGETPEQIGISQVNYDSRLKNINEFLETTGMEWSPQRYLVWLSETQIPPKNKTNAAEESKPKRPMPATLAELAKRFAEEGVKHAKNGFKKALNVEERQKICQECEYFTKSKRCQMCGCYMPVKTQWASASCPIDKWGENSDVL